MIDTDVFVNAAVARVEAYSTQARVYTQDAIAESRVNNEGFAYYGTVPQAVLPGDRPPFNPNADLSLEFRNAFADAFGDFHADMLDGLADYMARYFPTCITTNTDDWICATILSGGTGIPAAVEEAIWQRGRDRETVVSTQLERDTVGQFAARGFSLPSGALAARLLQVQQDATNKIVDLSRGQTIETLKIHIEQVKFAVEQGVKVRLGVLSALSDYLRAWMSPQATATDNARILVDSKSKLWNNAADYYRAMIQEAELSLEHYKIMAPSYTAGSINYNDRLRSQQESQVGAALKAADIMGSIASSSASSTTSIVGGEQHAITSLTA